MALTSWSRCAGDIDRKSAKFLLDLYKQKGQVSWTEFLCPLKIIFWSINLQYDDIWSWGLWEVIRFRWGHGASQVALVVKNSPNDAEDVRDSGSITALGRSPAGEHGNPLQYSCLENPTDRGSWCATVYRVAKSWTWLKWLSTHTQLQTITYRTDA